MSKTIELTDEQWAAYERGEPVTVQKPKLWEPDGGRFRIYANGEIIDSPSSDGYRQFGMEYPIRIQAERARDLMRPIHRYIAYAMGHWPYYEVPEPGEWSYFVAYDDECKKWTMHAHTVSRCPWVPYGPRDKVEELVYRLNRGEVKF